VVMYHIGRLEFPDGQDQDVYLEDIASDPDLCPLISHEGPLYSLRQPNVAVEPALDCYSRPLLVKDLSLDAGDLRNA